MNTSLEPGKYIVAVSGGVDSMVLLDLLRAQPGLALTVAHFDHGMRPDSAEDRRFVGNVAKGYGLPFVYDRVELGADASEATARTARYQFLDRTRRASSAQAIVTAHHQDDVLETAILNLLRGTGRKGLTSLQDRPDVRRPLIDLPKTAIIDYANQHNLTWREDVTNQDQTYRRNYVRHSLVAKLSPAERQTLIEILVKQKKINAELDGLLTNYLHVQDSATALHRPAFIELPEPIAKEVMASWLRANGLANFDKKTIERATHGAKTGRPGKLFEIKGGTRLVIGRDQLALQHPER